MLPHGSSKLKAGRVVEVANWIAIVVALTASGGWAAGFASRRSPIHHPIAGLNLFSSLHEM